MCICAHVCVVCWFSVGGREWGGRTSLCKYLLLGVGGYFDRLGRNDRGVVCVFSIVDEGGSVCGFMCVYTHTHTHTAQMGYSIVSPGVRMRQLENLRIQMDKISGIRNCIQSTHLYVYARRRDEILDQLLFPVNFLWERKAKVVNANH